MTASNITVGYTQSRTPHVKTRSSATADRPRDALRYLIRAMGVIKVSDSKSDLQGHWQWCIR